jgi:DNA-binding transcriptional LysR family regulator
MTAFTLHDLQCLDAVIRAGSFQAAASRLHRSHPAVFAAIAKLERQLDLKLLDRSGYRISPTQAGLSLHHKLQPLLQELEALQVHASQLAMGEESRLRVVIGDLCPRTQVLGILGRFFAECPATRLDLRYEAVTGPWERLLDDEADLILHRIDKGDARLEWMDLGTVTLVPVAAPGFLPFAVSPTLSPRQMRNLTQCIIRDTALHSGDHNYYVIEEAPKCTVADHQMKKELIVHGLAWGHLPHFLIEEELRDGRLLALTSRHYPGITETLVAARRRDRPHGPVANRLWNYLETAMAGQMNRLHADGNRQATRKKVSAKPTIRSRKRRNGKA